MEATVAVSGQAAVVDGGSCHRHSPPQLQQQVKIGPVPHFLAGGISGAFGKTCTAPLTRLTILFQTVLDSIGVLLWKIAAELEARIKMIMIDNCLEL